MSMRIVDVRKGLSKFYGTVHSFISIPHRGGTARFHSLTTPVDLKDIDADHIDRVIQIERPLLGPIPYRGGPVEIEVGLFSIKSADLAGPFLSVLQKMSEVAGVSYIKTALPFVEPIKEGVSLLLGGNAASVLEIGLSRSYSDIRTGFVIVMRAPKGKIDTSDLRMDGSDYRLTDSNGSVFGQYPYMVLQIVAEQKRDAWFNIPELSEPYKGLQDAVKKSNLEAVKQSLVIFKRAALTCDDLIAADSTRLADEVEKQVASIMQATLVARKEEQTLTDLQHVPLYPSQP
jgi:hypothetical protein